MNSPNIEITAEFVMHLAHIVAYLSVSEESRHGRIND